MSMQMLSKYYVKIYPDLGSNWRVYASRVIEDRRRKVRLIEVEGCRFNDEKPDDLTTEIFLMPYAKYVEIATSEGIELYQDPGFKIPDPEGCLASCGLRDWSMEVGEAVSSVKEGLIELPHQRLIQSAEYWTITAQSRYLESLITQIPATPIFFATDPAGTQGDQVVDGQMRLMAICNFYGIWGDELELTGLTILPRLNGQTRSKMLTDKGSGRILADDLHKFSIPAKLLFRWQHQTMLDDIRSRLNYQKT